eukprot:GGOE01004618.1.p1 GENE.GGOE01004618.1~~GGOE01004618.1.p1  ORF type:complete len:1011 (-),score=290.10 GGOE01004618.1:513-3407(-)
MSAVPSVKSLCKRREKWVESYLVASVQHILPQFANGKGASKACEETVTNVITRLQTSSVRILLDHLYQGMSSYKWQVKQGSMVLLQTLSKRHPTQVGRCLPEVVTHLIECLQDTKPEVRVTAMEVFKDVCRDTIGNPDVKPIMDDLIVAYSDPVNQTSSALDKLMMTTFVSAVDGPTLGLICPVLRRGMLERKAEFKRKAAIIIGNLCKLVVDPRDAMQFIPILTPVLEKGVDEIIYEDIRENCQKSLDTLKAVMGEAAAKDETSLSCKQLQDVVVDAICSNTEVPTEKVRGFPEVVEFVAAQCQFLVEMNSAELESWRDGIAPFLTPFLAKDDASKVAEVVRNVCKQYITVAEVVEDEGEDICNTEFSLAYGGKILLHNTRMRLKRGRKYGLVGKNGVGKTTLMRNIASKSVEGLPEDLRTVYVQSNIDVDEDMSCKKYLARAPELKKCTAKELDRMLTEVGFDEELKQKSVFSLSGGWRMKLALARAMLVHPDMLLLDEPTNHLDVNAVAWLTRYIQSLANVTCLIVSHSTSFCDDVCTDILHYENLKLVRYAGNLAAFVKKRPEAKMYYELEADTLKFVFPVPGRLEGVKSRSKKIIKMEKCTFQYPGTPKPQLIDCSCALSLGSRVAVLGSNGAGKSTLIKMLVAETVPSTGEVWKHHNVRIAYVAQHSFHHVEQHLDASPVAYIQWRFADGTDKEIMMKETMKLTEEEEANTGKTLGQVEALLRRRMRHKELEYEVKFVGRPEKDNRYLTRAQLIQMGHEKLMKQVDERVAAEEAGLDLRPLTTKEIQRHLDDFGLPQEFGTYGKIAGLSGGQKVKLVLAAAMWNCPHLMVLDEPTNFLDREALGALATAIKDFGGGVIMISHDKEFYSALCSEVWLVENNRLNIEGESGNEDVEVLVAKKRQVEEELTNNDLKEMAGGNTNVVKEKEVLVDFWGKPLNKKQIRDMQKKGGATPNAVKK